MLRGAAGWLGLAASPSFVLMAWYSEATRLPDALCSTGAGPLPIGGMTLMYLLMALFHLTPWLRLLSDRPRRVAHVTLRTEGDRP